ncbi:MAG: hypothetical protein Q8R18_02605 [bacterium]|nr:hypothetical protein [bacterium]
MTFSVLKSKKASVELSRLVRISPDYTLLGEFYEDTTNTQGGVDFLCLDLDKFLSNNKNGEEYGRLKNYSDELVQMNGLSILLLHRSRKGYIREHYYCYAFYVKVKK